MLNPMSEPDRSPPPPPISTVVETTATQITPKLGRVRSGHRFRADPAGLWPRLALASIVMHGLILAIVLNVSERASEARRTSVERNDDSNSGAIAIEVVASGDRRPGDDTSTAPNTSPVLSSIVANNPDNTTEFTDNVDPNSSQNSNRSQPFNPTPSQTPTATPTPTPSPTPDHDNHNESDAPGNSGETDRNPTGESSDTSSENPESSSPANDTQGNETGSPDGDGTDPTTSLGDDRLGLIVRLSPLASDNPDPDRRPAQLTAPVVNLDLPVQADPALLPDDLAIPFAIELQVELSIDPDGRPSLVRVLELDRDRELPQFEPLIATLIEGWQFEAASSVANGREVDQLDLVLALRWR
ncbi:MAG: hypothetical protein EAZ61_05930 [Oscillatoriales cyanobacterium]|nr:MAG: hypothetical protein EAZ61_05930 [Oscillatoriales cyanobacterium]